MTNRKSIYLDCIGPGTTEEKTRRRKPAAGFAAVEMPSIPAEERAQVKDLFRKNNLICPSIMTTGAWEYPATSPNAEIRSKSADCYKLAVDTAADMGCDTILTVPGAVTPEITYEMAWENAAKTIALVVPYAESKGITLAIENVWNKFLLSPREMVQFIDSFGSDYVKAYFDIGNIALYGFSQHWIKSLDSRIKRVHIKGFAMKGFEGFAWTQLLESTIDWKAVAEALKEVGYDSWVTAELGPDSRGLKGIADDIDHILALT